MIQAYAVENCDVMLAVLSKEYKKTAKCRLELEYAVNCNKKHIFIKPNEQFFPSGWLGLLMGSKLWFVLNNENFPVKCTSIINAIPKLLMGPSREKEIRSRPLPVLDASVAGNSSYDKKDFKMTPEHYKAWIKNNPSLSFMTSIFRRKRFNNEKISFLVKSQPLFSDEEFLKHLRDEYGLTLRQAEDLQKALELLD